MPNISNVNYASTTSFNIENITITTFRITVRTHNVEYMAIVIRDIRVTDIMLDTDKL